MTDENLEMVGRAEVVAFPEQSFAAVPARIDTGARTSAIWASAQVHQNGQLAVTFFGKTSPLYTGIPVMFEEFDTTKVASSNGHVQERFIIRLLIWIGKRKVRGMFTLADRSSQAYPVLVGRNVLRGKFLVDVKQGMITENERRRRVELDSRTTFKQEEQS